jgi:hypothetical protein
MPHTHLYVLVHAKHMLYLSVNRLSNDQDNVFRNLNTYVHTRTYLHNIIIYQSIRNLSLTAFRHFIDFVGFQYNYGTTGDTDIIYYCSYVAIRSYKYCVLRRRVKYYRTEVFNLCVAAPRGVIGYYQGSRVRSRN